MVCLRHLMSLRDNFERRRPDPGRGCDRARARRLRHCHWKLRAGPYRPPWYVEPCVYLALPYSRAFSALFHYGAHIAVIDDLPESPALSSPEILAALHKVASRTC